MACFLVPAAEAAIVTLAAKIAKSKEKESAPIKIYNESGSIETVSKIPFTKKVKWLTNLLWGGSALLAFEHVWHGEVVPYFPFLTNATNPADAAEMLHEMSTAGVMMAVLVTAVWVGMLAVSSAVEKRALKMPSKAGKEA